MIIKTIAIASVIAMFATSAFAGNDNGHDNGPNFGGGTSTATATAVAGATAVNSTDVRVTNTSKNYNTNSNRNTNTNFNANYAEGGNAVATGGTATASAGSAYAGGSNSSVTINNPDDVTVRSAPDAFAPSFSSGHPCAYSPATFGASIIGGGASLGGQKIDQACMLAQLGEKNAALALMAAKDKDVYNALVAAGRITPAQPARISSSGMSNTVAPKAIAKCEFDSAGNLVKVSKKPGISNADAISYCRGN